ncbi:MAG: hypothetical protein ABR616_18060 [Dermatophilaceae bacterium]
MDAKDLPGNRFVASFTYPGGRRRDLPRIEVGAETRETDEPFRYGYGVAIRIPLTRTAVVVGEWAGDLAGNSYESKLRSALKGSELDYDIETIKEW